MNLLDDVYRRARLLKQQTTKRYLSTSEYDVGPVALLVSETDFARLDLALEAGQFISPTHSPPTRLWILGVQVIAAPTVPDFKETP